MKTIKIVSWNVNGIRAVHKKGFLEWITHEQPDMVCLQETKAAEDQLPADLKNIPGYHGYFCSAERKGYSGVALYTKIKPDSVGYGFGIENFDREGRAIIAHYDSFVLFTVYFPNGRMSPERLRYKLDFYAAFLEHADAYKKQGKNIVICGDVNTAHAEIDLARPKANEKVSGFLPEERAWVDTFLQHGYIDTFRMFNKEPGQYTWWDLQSRARERNVGWRIDYFFVSEGFQSRVKSASIFPRVTGSDHCPVGLEIAI